MTNIPFAFRTNEGKYSFSGEARLINAYAEAQGTDAKAPLAALPCYGMTELIDVTDTPQRGQIYLDDLDCIYTVHATSVFKVASDLTVTRIGTIPGSDVVQMSRNQAEIIQISIHCAAGEYYIEADVVKKVTDEDLPTNVISQDHLGGYTIYFLDDRRFFLSSINACQDVNGLDYATAEQSADPAVRVKVDGDAFFFKRKQIEQWRNTGNADFPFEPIGTPIKHGLLAAEAVTAFDNTLAFLGDDTITYRIAGTGSVQRISTHSIERSVASDPEQSSIAAFSYTIEGHAFATLSGSNFTRSYDAATQFWHSRESYQLSKWRARNPIRAWGKTIVGDALSGNLYFLDKDSFVEGDQPMIWGMDTPTFSIPARGGVMDALFIDVATGVGTRSGQGTNPKLMLSWTTDGGKTYKGHRELSLGRRGKTVRLKTRRLGRFNENGVSFRIRVSDPTVRALIGLDLQVRPLKK